MSGLMKLLLAFSLLAARQSPTPPQPELVGEGSVSTPDDEFGGALSPDGQTLYFDKTVPAHYLYVMCVSHLVKGRWSTPEVLPFSGQWRDSDPVLTPDGSTLLFASDRPLDGGQDEHRFRIWAATQKASGWDPPRCLEGPVNEAGGQVFASMAANGNLYFTSSRKTGSYDIFCSRMVDGAYQPAEELSVLNGPGISSFEAFIAPDESCMVIGSFGREEGYGNSDLYISYHRDGAWTKPKNLGPGINTAAREYSPRISPDGKWLYFTSERGLATEKREGKRFTTEEFSAKARGLFNGLGNIYRVPMAEVLKTQP
jgi:hypothetical protein